MIYGKSRRFNKKERQTIKEYKVTTYTRTTHLYDKYYVQIVGGPLDQYIAAMRDEPREDWDSALGVAFPPNVIVLTDTASQATLIHECAHLTFFLLDWVGIEIESDNHEAFCYLLDYLVADVTKVLERHNEKNKKK